MKIHRKALSLFLCLALMLSIFGIDTSFAYAAQSNEPTVLYLDSGNITICDSGSYVITQHDSGKQTHTVTVTSGAPDIILADVNIDVSNTTDACAFSIAIGAAVNLTLEGSNTLKSGEYRAGLEVANNGTLPPDTTNSSALTITPQSTGSLAAIGGTNGCAGIGGGCAAGGTYACGGIITINGGEITAAGGPGGAGIGGGVAGDAGTITINGGMVTAKAGDEAAGIGGGSVGPIGTITINGGIVSAAGGYFGAGIGSGCGNDSFALNDVAISINGGTVTAAGGDDGAGIGGGYYCNGSTTKITGGTIMATSGRCAAGIGSGEYGHGGDVTISGADTQVTARAQDGGWGGVGYDFGCGLSHSAGDSLKVTGGATVVLAGSGTVTTTTPDYTDCQIISNTGAALKYNSSGTSSAVTLLTASVTALPVKNGIKLTASVSPDQAGTFTFSYQGEKDSGVFADSVPITNGKATAIWNNPSEGTSIISARYHTSGQYDALKAQYQYVSGSETTDLSTVHSSGFGYTYAGNTITLMDSGYYIFTGSTTSNKIVVPNGVSAGVTLKDASIRLYADNACAFSIAPGSAVNLTLKGTNTLKSGDFCAGLEVRGDNSNPPDKANNAFLTVTDASTGSLDATGGDNSAGIGGSMNGSGGTITINGGTVTATGGFDGAGIGGGYEGSGGTITISGGTVTANGGQSGAGVGGGYDGGNGGNITISGGTVNAIGNAGGAGIGGGKVGTGGSVKISGTDTNVTALGQGRGKDIGSGSYSNSGGTLSVAGVGLDKGPKVTLLSNGTNDVNPSGTNPQFMFCTINGVGAKDASGTDIHGCYNQNGKIRLSVTLSPPATAKVGARVLLTATVLRYYFNDAVPFSPSYIHFTDNGTTKLGDSVFIAPNGTAQTMWTLTRATDYQLMASFLPDALSPYASTDSSIIDYAPGKFTPVVSVLPTASTVVAGSLLSASTLSGGIMLDVSGNAVSGIFAWASPNDKAATTSNYYSAVFIPRDTDNYNAVSGIIVPVTVTPTPTPTPTPQSTSGSSSHGTSKPSLPTSLTDSSTSTTADLSGAAFPAGVTGVSLSVIPEAAGGGPSTPGNAGIPSDPQGAAVYRLIISQTDLNLIGSPFVYNIKLLDQNGNPITSFTGTVTVKVAIPTGIHGTPHIFRYEDSTGTFTDLNATVENGFLVFKTTHFSYYVIAGTGDSVTLDTKSYQLPVGANYQIGLKLTGGKAASVKLCSTNDKIASAAKLKNGNASVTGKGPGTAYIMFDVFDSKNELLTHASVRVDVKTGIRPRGDSTRQIGVF